MKMNGTMMAKPTPTDFINALYLLVAKPSVWNAL